MGETLLLQPLATMHSGGGVRAAKGSGSSNTDDVGFSFDADGDTGLFAVNGLHV